MSEYFDREVERLRTKVSDVHLELSSLTGEIKILKNQVNEAEQKIEQLSVSRETFKKSVELSTFAQESLRENVREAFEKIITLGLQHILGQDYSFVMDFSRRGNFQELDFSIKSKSLAEPFDPIDTSGGGVIDIVSFCLRVAVLEIYKPRVEGPILLDESFKHLSRQHLSTAGEFLTRVSKRVERQIIMVSHKSEFVEMADRAVKVG